MKLPLTIATLLLSLVTLAPTATSQKKTCSCQSPDRTCNTTVECSQNGCTSICGSNSVCYTSCGKDMLVTPFTLKLTTKNSAEIVSALSSYTSKKIEFVPWRRNGPFNIDIKDDDIWNTMDYLYERGKLKLGGVDWSEYQKMRKTASKGKKISQVDFNGISVRDALAHLSFLSGMPLRVESGDAEKPLTLSLREVTLDEVVSRISAQTGVKIEQTEKKDSIK